MNIVEFLIVCVGLFVIHFFAGLGAAVLGSMIGCKLCQKSAQRRTKEIDL